MTIALEGGVVGSGRRHTLAVRAARPVLRRRLGAVRVVPPVAATSLRPAALAGPAAHRTQAHEAARAVYAHAAVLTQRWLQSTFVHGDACYAKIRSLEARRTLARVIACLGRVRVDIGVFAGRALHATWIIEARVGELASITYRSDCNFNVKQFRVTTLSEKSRTHETGSVANADCPAIFLFAHPVCASER